MSDQEDESPSGLRQKLSEKAQEAKVNEEVARDERARRVIAEQGFTHLKPSDFAEVPLSEIEGRAQTLNDERKASADEQLRQALADRGIEDIDAALATLESGSSGQSDSAKEALARARQVGAASGGPVTPDITELAGRPDQVMALHFATKPK